MSGIVALLQRLVWPGLLAIVIVSPTQFAVEISRKTYVSLADPLVWGVFVLWLLSLTRSTHRSPLRFPPLMAVLFALIGALSLIRAVHPLKGIKDLLQWIEYFVVAFMLFANAPDRARTRVLRDVFLAIASVIILTGLVQYLNPATPDFKVRATFGNRNVFGGYLALVLPLMTGIALYETCRWRQVWLLSIVAVGLLVTLSGGAWLAIALTLGLLCAMRGKTAFVALAVVLTVMLALILPHLPRHNDAALDESVRLFNDRNEVSLRYTEWQAATVMISEHPWLGVGLGNYQDNIGGYFGVLPRPTGVVEHDSENLYLVMASSAGLPGLAAFLGLVMTFGVTAARRFFAQTEPRERGLALGLLGAILAFALCAVWHPLLVRGIGIPLAIVFAMTAWLEQDAPVKNG